MNAYHLLIIAIVVVLAGIIGFISVKYLGNNNPVEKVAEEVIKDETGISVNLTPSDTKTTPSDTKTTPSDTKTTPPTTPKAP